MGEGRGQIWRALSRPWTKIGRWSGLGRELHPGKKGRPAVGITKRGRGTKLMVVSDGEGLPIGLLVASARPHELTLARAALGTVGVPRRRGRMRPMTAGSSGDVYGGR